MIDRFLKHWKIVVVIAVILIGITILVSLTKKHFVSAFIIEYLNTWSTFIGALAALLIVVMAFVTYWEERRTRRLEMRNKLIAFAIDALAAWDRLNGMSRESEPLTRTDRKIILGPLEKATSQATEVSTTAEIFGGEMKTHIEAILRCLADMELLLLNKDPIMKAELLNEMKSVPSIVEEIIRYENI